MNQSKCLFQYRHVINLSDEKLSISIRFITFAISLLKLGVN